ncbi:hypothetical protein BpHYR1_016571 [Brachionus plicatilis]|uniref:Secreted protein n=1 Tax=Brachionus plicatilis TaxID=10195 RepID=A0A3M7QLI4_BRAPC|nr:hypothetical protein BpHYR1_016571 [Brachionus plicatilis]
MLICFQLHRFLSLLSLALNFFEAPKPNSWAFSEAAATMMMFVYNKKNYVKLHPSLSMSHLLFNLELTAAEAHVLTTI